MNKGGTRHGHLSLEGRAVTLERFGQKCDRLTHRLCVRPRLQADAPYLTAANPFAAATSFVRPPPSKNCHI
jgi:hypothetical protein